MGRESAPRLRSAQIFTTGFVRAYRQRKRLNLFKTAKYRMNIEDLRGAVAGLHHFRIIPLWTGCTRLIYKKLPAQKFH